MIYTWYKIFNKDAFLATGLVSRNYSLDLANRGMSDFLVTLGDCLSITHQGVMLALELNGKNPFEFENMAIYIDVNNDVYWGYLVSET